MSDSPDACGGLTRSDSVASAGGGAAGSGGGAGDALPPFPPLSPPPPPPPPPEVEFTFAPPPPLDLSLVVPTPFCSGVLRCASAPASPSTPPASFFSDSPPRQAALRASSDASRLRTPRRVQLAFEDGGLLQRAPSDAAPPPTRCAETQTASHDGPPSRPAPRSAPAAPPRRYAVPLLGGGGGGGPAFASRPGGDMDEASWYALWNKARLC